MSHVQYVTGIMLISALQKGAKHKSLLKQFYEFGPRVGVGWPGFCGRMQVPILHVIMNDLAVFMEYISSTFKHLCIISFSEYM